MEFYRMTEDNQIIKSKAPERLDMLASRFSDELTQMLSTMSKVKVLAFLHSTSDVSLLGCNRLYDELKSGKTLEQAVEIVFNGEGELDIELYNN